MTCLYTKCTYEAVQCCEESHPCRHSGRVNPCNKASLNGPWIARLGSGSVVWKLGLALVHSGSGEVLAVGHHLTDCILVEFSMALWHDQKA